MEHTPVLIAGGGPVGLMLAAELQRRNVAHRLIEQSPQPIRLVKALGITPRTLEIWDQMGILNEAIDAGAFLRGNCTLVNGELVDTQEVPRDRFPIGFLTLAQYEAERILREHLLRLGGDVEWGTALTAFREVGDAIVARVRRADGTEREIECRYLAGCDGAHSVVRRGLGLDFTGDAVPMVFMLGDVLVDWDRPRGYVYRMLHLIDGQMVNQGVAVPIPGDLRRHRVSLAAPPEYWEEGADLSRAPSLELLTQTMEPMLPRGTRLSGLRWSSLYRISHRIAARYSRGRGFLVGDAAHIHPPIGGQGMNTGLQDAFNLGWKLALAVEGDAAPDLLESYDTERRPVGLDVVTRTSRRMEQAIEGEDRGESIDQLEVDSQLGVAYRDSRWVGEDVAPHDGTDDGDVDREPRHGAPSGLRAGDRAPDVGGLGRAYVERSFRLAELLRHPGHTLLLHADGTTGASDQRAWAELADALPRDRVRVYGIAAPGTATIEHERFSWLEDREGRFARAYGAGGGSVFLVRPDGVVGYRASRADAARLDAHLTRVLGRRQPSRGA